VWGAIDEVVQVRDCDIYSYIPDMDADPFTDGNLWSFNYFFYNKSLQKLLYFTCMAESKFSNRDVRESDDDESEEERGSGDEEDEEMQSQWQFAENDDNSE
jgi:hypothetical protein